MPRKTFIIIIVSFVLIVIGVAGFSYVKNKSSVAGNGGAITYKDFLPFGKSGDTQQTTNESGTEITPTVVTTQATDTQPAQTEDITTPTKFRHITGFAVSGASSFEEVKPTANTSLNNGTASIGTTDTSLSTTSKTATQNKTTVAKTKVKALPVAPVITETTVRYIDKATGHLFKQVMDTHAETQISNTTIPKAQEIWFGANGASAVYRYLASDNQTIRSFLGVVFPNTDPTLPGKLKGYFLPDTILSGSVSPDQTKAFYLTSFNNGVVGIIIPLSGDKKTVQVFSSPFSEWLTQWASSTILSFTTKAASGIDGYVYMYDLNAKKSTKILGPLPGLTTLLSPDGKTVLYSKSDANNSLSLNLFSLTTRRVTSLAIQTLPEKCVWAKSSVALYCGAPDSLQAGTYPDDWYQGKVSFSDSLFKISADTGASQKLERPFDSVDMTQLFLSPKENYLFFVNKKDSTMWSYSFN